MTSSVPRKPLNLTNNLIRYNDECVHPHGFGKSEILLEFRDNTSLPVIHWRGLDCSSERLVFIEPQLGYILRSRNWSLGHNRFVSQKENGELIEWC